MICIYKYTVFGVFRLNDKSISISFPARDTKQSFLCIVFMSHISSLQSRISGICHVSFTSTFRTEFLSKLSRRLDVLHRQEMPWRK